MKRSFITKMVNLMLAVLLCITMLPAGAFAAEGDTAPAAPAPATARSFTWYGHKLQFKSFDVIVDQPLDANSEPLNLKVKAKKKKTVIKWSSERAPGSVEGYILLRRKGKKGAFKEIAVLPAGSVKYVDKIKKKKKTAYTLVGFRRDTYGIHISPCSGEGRAPGRVYQNPSRYVQITDQIDKHGLGYYTAPVLVNSRSTREDHIEALIKTAYKYLGDRYVVCRSGAPGEGLDCSGLVMQACYGAGVDLWPVNPWRHRLTKYEYESRNIAKMDSLKTVAYKKRQRGDLIFFKNRRGKVIHVAIYLGNNKIIHSTSVGGHVVVTGMGGGAYGKPFKAKRIFN